MKFRLELRDIKIAHERVLHYLRQLVNFPEERTITLDCPLKDIAEDIGLTPETLSRELIRLETDGAIAQLPCKIKWRCCIYLYLHLKLFLTIANTFYIAII